MPDKVTILMVDDHPENLLALEAVLTDPSYELIGLTSGEDALRYILREDMQRLAVILMDVQMPGMNGFETAKLIKSRGKSHEIPIIFITAISKSMEHVLEGYHAGSIDYIFKPFHPDLLRLKVGAFVKMHRYHQKIQRQGEMLQRRARELEQMNRTLARTEALARMVGETSVDTIVTFDGYGRILSLNPAVRRMFGFTEEELIGSPIQRMLPEVAEAPADESRERKLKWQVPFHRIVELTAVRSNGETFPVDCQVGEAVLEDLRCYVCSIRDASERKQLEEERSHKFTLLENMVRERTHELVAANEKFKKSKERFQKMFQSSPCLISICRLADMKYMDVNNSWLTMTGYEYEEVIGATRDLLQVAVQPQPPSHGDGAAGVPNRNVKIKYATKTGEVRDGLQSTEIIELDEEKCLLRVITDITDKVIYEKEVARLARLNLVGEMAAGIAHEIRNPMTTIYGFLQLSRKNAGNMPAEYIDIMLDELNRANSIITEYLTLAKNKTTDRRETDLNSIIQSLYPLIQAETMLTDKFLRVHYGDCPPLQLDEKEIRQLILNLAMNGIEAMPPGGTLTIRTYNEDPEVIVLEVGDQGSGILEAYLEKLGTPFFTTKENGTGLGLAVCYSIASRHRADIRVKSGPEGTTFYVRFRTAGSVDPAISSAKKARGYVQI